MEINKKLDIFYEAAIAAAERQSSDILEEQKKLCRESLEEYGKSRQAAEELGGRIAADKIKKEINRSISEPDISLQKGISGQTRIRKRRNCLTGWKKSWRLTAGRKAMRIFWSGR